MFSENLTADVSYYNIDTMDVETVKLCTIMNEFVFSRTEFVLCSKKVKYYVCIYKDGNLFSVWSHEIGNLTPSEAMSEFRNRFSKNNITKEMIELFISDPKKYKKKYRSKNKVK